MNYILSIVVAVGLLGCASTPSEKLSLPAVVEVIPPLSRIIDAHVHLDDLEKEAANPSSWSDFRHQRVVGLVAHASRRDPIPARMVAPIPVIRCAGLSLEVRPKEVEEGLKDGRVQCLKVYLGYVPRYAYDPFYKPFYKLAEKYRVPVVFHTGDTYDKRAKVKYADPLTIDEVAVDHPKVNFVIAHLGNPWFASAAEVLYKNDNVYADTSALMLGDLSKSSKETIEELVVKPVKWVFTYVENPKKFMFGSDWPLLKLAPYIEAIQRAIPAEHWDDVFFANAQRVFNFPGDSKQRIARGKR